MPETEATPQKPRILIADDSKVVMLTATKILDKHFDIVKAADGQIAWDTLNSDPSIQVVVTDLGMPNLDGYGLIKNIRQAEQEDIRNLPIMVITGNAEDEAVKKKVLEIGATDFITKPFAGAEFIARLQAHASYRRDRSSLQESTNIDLLTGTLNRKALQQKLEQDIAFVARHGQSLVVIIFELDNYKTIADKAGQATADKIVQNISKVLTSAIRREDSFGRYGAATFMTILPMAKIDGVVMLVKRLCDHIKTFTYKIGNESFKFTLSAGIASLPRGCPTDVKTLFAGAEQALENAHALGPGEFQLLKLESNRADDTFGKVSIDDLLEIISEKERPISESELIAAEKQLQPLLALISKVRTGVGRPT
ncbi:diguanylate cyclase (GGDEF)-like protein [Alteromonadaceae bacterium 2753L.S.0a.02]|nr:diguanylate cyclase (GGDEF)-like protein [Alteromonadaceae bacterium 2753L.S.0a.02]